jgi:hypothetical protein
MCVVSRETAVRFAPTGGPVHPQVPLSGRRLLVAHVLPCTAIDSWCLCARLTLGGSPHSAMLIGPPSRLHGTISEAGPDEVPWDRAVGSQSSRQPTTWGFRHGKGFVSRETGTLSASDVRGGGGGSLGAMNDFRLRCRRGAPSSRRRHLLPPRRAAGRGTGRPAPGLCGTPRP